MPGRFNVDGRKLDPRQFPELNAAFYMADPADFIRMRIEVLSLMACEDEDLRRALIAFLGLTD
jgi:hypothetical protein